MSEANYIDTLYDELSNKAETQSEDDIPDEYSTILKSVYDENFTDILATTRNDIESKVESIIDNFNEDKDRTGLDTQLNINKKIPLNEQITLNDQIKVLFFYTIYELKRKKQSDTIIINVHSIINNCIERDNFVIGILHIIYILFELINTIPEPALINTYIDGYNMLITQNVQEISTNSIVTQVRMGEIHGARINNVITSKAEELKASLEDKIENLVDDTIDNKFRGPLTNFASDYSTNSLLQLGRAYVGEHNATITSYISNITDNIMKSKQQDFIDNIETNVLKDKISEFTTTTSDFNTKLNAVVEDLYTNFDSLNDELKDRFNIPEEQITGINTDITDMQTQINTQIDDMNDNVSNILSGTNNNLESIIEQIHDKYTILDNKLINLMTAIEDGESTLLINNKLRIFQQAANNQYKQWYDIVNARSSALQGQIDSLRSETDAKIIDLDTSLKGFMKSISDDIRSTFTKDREYNIDNRIISGKDLLEITVEQLINKKIERNVVAQFKNDSLPTMKLVKYKNSEQQLIIEFIFQDSENLNTDSINLTSTDEKNNKELQKSVQKVNGIEKITMNSKINENISFLDLLYIFKKRKISSYSNKITKDTGINYDSICTIDLTLSNNDAYSFEARNIVSIEPSSDNKVITITFNALYFTMPDNESHKQNISFKTLNDVEIDTKGISKIYFLFFALQEPFETIHDTILKSEYETVVQILQVNLYNNSAFNNFFNNKPTVNTDKIIQAENIFETTSTFTISLQDLKINPDNMLNVYIPNTTDNNQTKLFKDMFWSKLLLYYNDITVNFTIEENTISDIQQLTIQNGGTITFNTSTANADYFKIGNALIISNSESPLEMENYLDKEYYIISKITDNNEDEITKIELIISENKNSGHSVNTGLINTVNSNYSIKTYKNPDRKIILDDILDLLAWNNNIISDLNQTIYYLLIEYNKYHGTTFTSVDLKKNN